MKPSTNPYQEWHTLHRGCEQSEALALVIKLFAFGCCIAAISLPQQLLISALLPLLWLQEAIWKTFQSRSEQRLLIIEKTLAQGLDCTPSLYSDWQAQRPGLFGLIGEYLRTAIRPTIACPHCLLIVVALLA